MKTQRITFIIASISFLIMIYFYSKDANVLKLLASVYLIGCAVLIKNLHSGEKTDIFLENKRTS
jgi:hypothetical protein